MRWILRSRHATLIIAAIAVALTLTIVLTGVLAPYPSLGPRAGLAIPASLATPQLTALATLGLLLSSNPAHELTAVRPILTYERTVAYLVAAISVAVIAVAVHFLDTPLLYASARNQLGLTGLGLLIRRYSSPAAACVAPIAYSTIVFCLGNRESPSLWDWLLAPQATLSAATIAAALFIAGTTLGISRASQQRQQHWVDV